MGNYPPVFYWFPPELANCWWVPVAWTGYGVRLLTEDDHIKKFHEMAESGFLSTPLDHRMISDVVDGSRSGIIECPSGPIRIDVVLDRDGRYGSEGSWWMSTLNNKSEHLDRLIRIFVASGARREWGSAGCKIIYLCPRGFVDDWAARLSPLGVTVHQEPSRGNRANMQWDGLLSRNGVSIEIHTGVAIEPDTGDRRYYFAINYLVKFLAYFSQRKLIKEIEDYLVLEGLEQIEFAHCAADN